MRGRHVLMALAFSAPLALTAFAQDEGEGTADGAHGGWAPKTNAEKRLAKLIPTKKLPVGWRLAQGPRIYDEVTLYEHIDGAAQFFIDYGFRLIATARFEEEADPQSSIQVDVYDMGTSEMGFGIYSAHRPPEAQFLEMGNQGFAVPGGLFAYKGRYFLQLASTKRGDPMQNAMIALGQAIAGAIGKDQKPPAILSRLPQQDLVPNTAKITAKHVLGQSYLENAVFAEYTEGEGQARLFALDAGSPDDAAAKLARYKQFVEEQGEVTGDVTDLGHEGFTAKIPYSGDAIVVRLGQWIVGELNVQDEAQAKARLRMLIVSVAPKARGRDRYITRPLPRQDVLDGAPGGG
jgi:hypothetical protein